MFEDVCLLCSRPVDDSGSSYCSEECAAQDIASATTTSDDRESTSSLSSAPSPYLHPLTKPSPLFGPFGLTTPDTDSHTFTLNNPHPTFADYPLPITLASPTLSGLASHTRSKHSSKSRQTSSHRPHMRKRSSLSSSSISSALSTPSEPPLTDDYDSLSDPEFTLDVAITNPAPSRPALHYARRPSNTNTRSTIPKTSASSTSSSVSHGQRERERTRSRPRHQRPRHAHHLSVPLIDTVSRAHPPGSFHFDPLCVAEDDRPHAYISNDNRNDHRESSYATLTKLSAAAVPHAAATSSSSALDTIRQQKSRRPSALSSKPRSSLPAYFNLLKMSSPPPDTATAPSSPPPSADLISPPLPEGSFSSPGSTRTARLSRSAHRPVSRHAHHHRAESYLSGKSPNLTPNLNVRATPVSAVSPLHGVGSVYGVQPGVTSCAVRAASVAVRGQGLAAAAAAAAALVPLPVTPTSPRDLGSASPRNAPDDDDSEVEVRPDLRSKPMLFRPVVASAVSAAAAEGAGSSGTPRGRTRSRSTRPRSRSRSRSKRRHDGERGGIISISEGREARRDRRRSEDAEALAVGVAAALAYATRGRPHARGIGGGGRGRRTRRGTGPSAMALTGGFESDEDVEGLDEIAARAAEEERRGRRRGVGVPVPAS